MSKSKYFSYQNSYDEEDATLLYRSDDLESHSLVKKKSNENNKQILIYAVVVVSSLLVLSIGAFLASGIILSQREIVTSMSDLGTSGFLESSTSRATATNDGNFFMFAHFYSY